MVKLSNMASYAEKRITMELWFCRPVLHTAEAADTFFSALEQAGFGLERYNDQEPVNLPFSREAAQALWTKGRTIVFSDYSVTSGLFIGVHAKPRVEVLVTWGTSPEYQLQSHLGITLYKGPFLKQQDAFLQIFRGLIQAFSPACAYIGSQLAWHRQGGALWGCHPGIYWLNYFGREYADFIGRDRILGCGWERTEVFGEGILTWALPSADLPTEELQVLEALYRGRLGTQYFRGPGKKYAEAILPELLPYKIRIVGENPGPTPIELAIMRAKGGH